MVHARSCRQLANRQKHAQLLTLLFFVVVDQVPGNDAQMYFFHIFSYFSGPGPVPEASPGLEVRFPVKNAGFGCVFAELRHFSSFLETLNFQAVIKSAASAASLDLQGSPQTTARHADGGARGLPCKSREAALAADLNTA